MPRQREINENSQKYCHSNATSLRQPKGLEWNIKEPVVVTVLTSHAQQRLKCPLTSMFEASDDVLMMRPTTYFFIPCNQTDIKETLLACTHRNERPQALTCFSAEPRRGCRLTSGLAADILRGPVWS